MKQRYARSIRAITTPAIHRGAFALPNFVAEALAEVASR